MKASFALEISSPETGAEFFAALAEAFRHIAQRARKAVLTDAAGGRTVVKDNTALAAGQW